MKIGLLREGKVPPDKRVPFAPSQCRHILTHFPQVSLYIQPSKIRCFSDSEYQKNGVELREDLSICDSIMGIKEVPIDMLIDDKLFFFFSHTLKKQPYNQNLLKKIIEKKIQLIDYETLVYDNKKRIIGFGRYAGLVGCYNTFLAYGKKSKRYDLSFAHLLSSKKEMDREVLKVNLPSDFKVVLTGDGRVSSGVIEVLDLLNIKKISKEDFLDKKFNYPVYVQLSSSDYNERIDGFPSSNSDFYISPNNYKSCLLKYVCNADMLITGHYYAPGNPTILSKEDIRNHLFKIQVIGDISCDINGPIASTIHPSTTQNPIYGYNPFTESKDNYEKDDVIVVMAVDNLPCSLPKDASIDFGKVFIDKILPDLLVKGAIISRATITFNGKLTKQFNYLQDYIN